MDTSSPARSRVGGRRLVFIGGAITLVAGALVLLSFRHWGVPNFTRTARTIEARARAFELANGLVRWLNKDEKNELPASVPVHPSAPPRGLWLDEAKSKELFADDVFRRAEFNPRGELHVQVEWQRVDAKHGIAIALLDENGDGQPDFEARSIVDCTSAPPERCHPLQLTEQRR